MWEQEPAAGREVWRIRWIDTSCVLLMARIYPLLP